MKKPSIESEVLYIDNQPSKRAELVISKSNTPAAPGAKQMQTNRHKTWGFLLFLYLHIHIYTYLSHSYLMENGLLIHLNNLPQNLPNLDLGVFFVSSSVTVSFSSQISRLSGGSSSLPVTCLSTPSYCRLPRLHSRKCHLLSQNYQYLDTPIDTYPTTEIVS